MFVKLMGKSKVNFTNSNNETISGVNLFVAFNDENVEGLRCDKVFVKNEELLPADVKINDTLDLSFNYKGKL